MFKELHIGVTPPEIKIANLKITPVVTSRVSLAIVIRKPIHKIIFGEQFRVLFDESFYGIPERWDSILVLEERKSETINFVVVLHEQEGIVV
jgi:hypothetical protein